MAAVYTGGGTDHPELYLYNSPLTPGLDMSLFDLPHFHPSAYLDTRSNIGSGGDAAAADAFVDRLKTIRDTLMDRAPYASGSKEFKYQLLLKGPDMDGTDWLVCEQPADVMGRCRKPSSPTVFNSKVLGAGANFLTQGSQALTTNGGVFMWIRPNGWDQSTGTAVPLWSRAAGGTIGLSLYIASGEVWFGLENFERHAAIPAGRVVSNTWVPVLFTWSLSGTTITWTVYIGDMSTPVSSQGNADPAAATWLTEAAMRRIKSFTNASGGLSTNVAHYCVFQGVLSSAERSRLPTYAPNMAIAASKVVDYITLNGASTDAHTNLIATRSDTSVVGTVTNDSTNTLTLTPGTVDKIYGFWFDNASSTRAASLAATIKSKLDANNLPYPSYITFNVEKFNDPANQAGYPFDDEDFIHVARNHPKYTDSMDAFGGLSLADMDGVPPYDTDMDGDPIPFEPIMYGPQEWFDPNNGTIRAWFYLARRAYDYAWKVNVTDPIRAVFPDAKLADIGTDVFGDFNDGKPVRWVPGYAPESFGCYDNGWDVMGVVDYFGGPMHYRRTQVQDTFPGKVNRWPNLYNWKDALGLTLTGSEAEQGYKLMAPVVAQITGDLLAAYPTRVAGMSAGNSSLVSVELMAGTNLAAYTRECGNAMLAMAQAGGRYVSMFEPPYDGEVVGYGAEQNEHMRNAWTATLVGLGLLTFGETRTQQMFSTNRRHRRSRRVLG